jgi:hypothetical protein
VISVDRRKQEFWTDVILIAENTHIATTLTSLFPASSAPAHQIARH